MGVRVNTRKELIRKNAQILPKSEFFKLASRLEGKASISETRRWWNVFYEVIAREMLNNGACRIPDIGIFRSVYIEGTTQTHRDIKTGELYDYTVPARYLPQFEAEDSFINDINLKAVTKACRQRERTNKITKKDVNRAARLKQAKELEKQIERAEVLEEAGIDGGSNDMFDTLMARKSRAKVKRQVGKKDEEK